MTDTAKRIIDPMFYPDRLRWEAEGKHGKTLRILQEKLPDCEFNGYFPSGYTVVWSEHKVATSAPRIDKQAYQYKPQKSYLEQQAIKEFKVGRSAMAGLIWREQQRRKGIPRAHQRTKSITNASTTDCGSDTQST